MAKVKPYNGLQKWLDATYKELVEFHEKHVSRPELSTPHKIPSGVDWREKAVVYNKEADRKVQLEKHQAQLHENGVTYATMVAEYERDIAKAKEFQRKFKCAVCGIHSAKPKRGVDDAGVDSYSPVYFTDWLTPADLEKCTICHKWVCSKHHRGKVCKKCAKDL